MNGNLWSLKSDSNGFLALANSVDYGPLCTTRNVTRYPGSAEQANDWVSTILGSDSSVATPDALLLALRHQAPLYVVRFFLAINPNVISIPKSGPTALQVAVQYGAPLDVIQALLEACPFGLCVTNPDHPEDPLSYAKRYHRDRPGLIELLSRPLSYWITERKQRKQQERDQNHSLRALREDPDASITSYSKNIVSSMASALQDSRVFDSKQVAYPGTMNNVDPMDHVEIQNIKDLCLQLLRAHKKMAKQIVAFRDEIQLQSQAIVENNNKKVHFNTDDVLNELHEQQKHHFYRQLIALDMKEKAFKARVREIEKSCLSKVDATLNEWRKDETSWKASTQEQLNELQVLMDYEVKINAHFRNDLVEYMEDQQRRESRQVSSFLFATNLGELNEAAPLCGWVTNTMEHKKRPRRPLFRQWE